MYGYGYLFNSCFLLRYMMCYSCLGGGGVVVPSVFVRDQQRIYSQILNFGRILITNGVITENFGRFGPILQT